MAANPRMNPYAGRGGAPASQPRARSPAAYNVAAPTGGPEEDAELNRAIAASLEGNDTDIDPDLQRVLEDS